MKAKTKTITVKVNEQNPEPLEILAKAIIDLSDGLNKTLDSKLTKRAIVALLKDSTGLPKGEIETILNAISELKKAYTK